MNNENQSTSMMNESENQSVDTKVVETIGKEQTSFEEDNGGFSTEEEKSINSETKKDSSSKYKVPFLDDENEIHPEDETESEEQEKEKEKSKRGRPKKEAVEFKEIEEKQVSQYGDIVNDLLNNDLIEVDETKEYEDSINGLRDILKDNVESIKRKSTEEFMSKLSDKAKRLIELDLQGVDIKGILQNEPESLSFDYNSIDMDDEDNQKELYKDFLSATGNDEDDIDELLETAEDTGTLSRYAKAAQKYFIKESEKQNQLRAKELSELSEKVKRDEEQFFEDYKNNILNTKEIKGIEISKDKAEKLFNYMSLPVDKQGRTQWMLDSESLDQKKVVAYMMMNKFDFSKIEQKIETRKTIELKKKLSNYTDRNTGSRGTSVNENDQEQEVKMTSNKPFWQG